MREYHRVRALGGAISCLALCGALSAPGGAQTAPAAPAAADAATAAYCPLHVRVYALKGLADELAFAIWADDTGGAASGTIVTYVNGGRYTIPFTDAIAADERDAKALPTPIVVKFDAPAQFESAYVGALEGSDCAVHAPFVRKPLTTVGFAEDTKISIYPDRSRDWPAYLAQAATMAPLPAPAPVPEEKPACASPNSDAMTKDFRPPLAPNRNSVFFGGDIIVKIALATTGKIDAMRVDKSSRDKSYDTAAIVSAVQSTYAPEIYRCKAVTADLYLDVKFDPHEGERPSDYVVPTPTGPSART